MKEKILAEIKALGIKEFESLTSLTCLTAVILI